MNTIFTDFIKNSESFSSSSLSQLNHAVNEYPYFQPARLLMLVMLHKQHHSNFDRELRKSAFYLTDRTLLFQLIEGENFTFKPSVSQVEMTEGKDRTDTLLTNFLSSLPQERIQRNTARVDATTNYIDYLLQTEDHLTADTNNSNTKPLQRQDLIDDFIKNGDITLDSRNESEIQNYSLGDEQQGEENYFTETLAQIYIRQGRYAKAIEIIKKLSLKYPKKNRYFADQIRFLQKLIINNKTKNS